ncbi:MAG: flagellar protein FlaG [Epsilonproteobacteria bacterium]|nr:flagellar protein FlaG [Campylobacterota bacterium]
MDGIANVARQQQTQINSTEIQGKATQQVQQHKQETPKADMVEQIQKSAMEPMKIDSKEQVEDLVAKLNSALAPMNTNLKFGVDLDDIFYVSVVESETSKMIRRFPAEKAADFLPKMQELTGMLFDSKG